MKNEQAKPYHRQHYTPDKNPASRVWDVLAAVVFFIAAFVSLAL